MSSYRSIGSSWSSGVTMFLHPCVLQRASDVNAKVSTGSPLYWCSVRSRVPSWTSWVLGPNTHRANTAWIIEKSSLWETSQWCMSSTRPNADFRKIAIEGDETSFEEETWRPITLYSIQRSECSVKSKLSQSVIICPGLLTTKYGNTKRFFISNQFSRIQVG